MPAQRSDYAPGVETPAGSIALAGQESFNPAPSQWLREIAVRLHCKHQEEGSETPPDQNIPHDRWQWAVIATFCFYIGLAVIHGRHLDLEAVLIAFAYSGLATTHLLERARR
jgi:hypothetical protein